MLHDRLSQTPVQVWKENFAIQKGDIGVELEIEGRNLYRETIPGWTSKEDHSLRGEALEYTTRGAVEFQKFGKSLDNLFSMFEKHKTEIIPSDRCSTHFHLNMQNETFRTYFGTIFVFTILEPILLRLCGPNRNGNLFCMPSYETGDLPYMLRQQSVALRRTYVEWPRRGKYATMCLDNMPTFGSLEIRCFPLSEEKSEIHRWAGWCYRMRELAKSWPNDTYSDLGNNPESLAYQVFSDVNLYCACQPEPVSNLLDLGCENAYEAWRACDSVFFHDPAKERKAARKVAARYAIPEEVVMNGDYDLSEETMEQL